MEPFNLRALAEQARAAADTAQYTDELTALTKALQKLLRPSDFETMVLPITAQACCDTKPYIKIADIWFCHDGFYNSQRALTAYLPGRCSQRAIYSLDRKSVV